MLDLQHLVSSSRADVQVFIGTRGSTVSPWQKPRGVSMIYMLVLGSGGNGGNGAVGAASTAAGGGGGGSGAQATLLVPAIFLPDVLQVWTGFPGFSSTVSLRDPLINGGIGAGEYILLAAAGGAGGNASGATGGTSGTAGGVPAIGNNPLAGLGRYTFLAGQAGVGGGTTSFASDLIRPTTGLVVTGGTGGGGLGAAGTGTNGGGNILAAGVFPSIRGGGSGLLANTNSRGENGSSGHQSLPGLLHFSGGAGGASQATNITPAAAGGGFGGNGAPGCGGGGGGGGFTGSTQALGGSGGPGLVIIIAW